MDAPQPHVFVTRRLPGNAHERIANEASLDVWPADTPVPYDVLVERTRQADGIVCMLTDRIDAELFEKAGRLRVVSQMAVGVDNIDLDAASRHGVGVGHTPDVLVETTADLTWALILAAARRVTEAERYLRAGRWRDWDPELLCGMDVHGATLGIVGMGRIGAAVARRAKGFNMRVVYTSRTEKAVDGADPLALDELLEVADIVSIHCALTPSTRGLIGPRELSRMRPGAILVNTARGPIVDEMALVDTLRSGGIRAAGLDVYPSEPLPHDSPLLDLDNVVLLPHVGSASVTTRRKMAEVAVDNVLAGLRRQPLPHQVT